MINEYDSKCIAEDAYIACDALQSLIAGAPYLHKNYVREKLKVVKECIKFIEQFEGETE